MHDVIDNRGSRRFELLEQGQIAYADYEIDGDRLILPHVEAPIGLRGTGAGLHARPRPARRHPRPVHRR